MAEPLDNDEQEKPLDPAVERVRRKLVRFIAINLGILFLALMAVVVALVYRATRVPSTQPASVSELPTPPPGSMLDGRIALPAGARVVSHAVSASRISLHVELPDGETAIFVYDTAEGRMVGRFSIVEAP